MTNRTASFYLFICISCIYLLTAGGHYGGDGFWNYLTARSLILNGDLVISDQNFAIPEMQRQYQSVASSNRTYSKYGLGLPLAELPFLGVGHILSQFVSKLPTDYLTMFTTSLTNVFICALWSLGFFRLALQLGYQHRTVWWLTLFFALGSMVFPYAGYGFSEPLVGISLLGATGGCFFFVKNEPLRALVVVSICIGLAILTKLYVIITLPIFLLYMWPTFKTQSNKRLPAITILAPLLFFLIVILFHNHIRYNNIFHTGYHLDTLSQQGGYFAFYPTQIITALYGLLFSTGRGLVFFLPVVCLFPFAYRHFKVSHPKEAKLFLRIIIIHLILFTFMIDWHAGSSWGPRYLLPIIPYLILPLGSLIESADKKRVLAFGIAGMITQFPGALINPHLFVRFVQDKKIGDLIFYPGHPGDMLFSPYLSPILGGYYQLVSGLKHILTGTSLTYTISSGTERSLSASLKNYDTIDIWWLNAIQTGLLNTTLTFVLLFSIIILIAIAIYTMRQLIIWQRQPEGNAP
ncbi:MAG: hypothetical protein ACI8V2_001695 [Candidatus Latescibacterota bacterium]|jgi:hypothetical protein